MLTLSPFTGARCLERGHLYDVPTYTWRLHLPASEDSYAAESPDREVLSNTTREMHQTPGVRSHAVHVCTQPGRLPTISPTHATPTPTLQYHTGMREFASFDLAAIHSYIF